MRFSILGLLFILFPLYTERDREVSLEIGVSNVAYNIGYENQVDTYIMSGLIKLNNIKRLSIQEEILFFIKYKSIFILSNLIKPRAIFVDYYNGDSLSIHLGFFIGAMGILLTEDSLHSRYHSLMPIGCSILLESVYKDIKKFSNWNDIGPKFTLELSIGSIDTVIASNFRERIEGKSHSILTPFLNLKLELSYLILKSTAFGCNFNISRYSIYYKELEALTAKSFRVLIHKVF